MFYRILILLLSLMAHPLQACDFEVRDAWLRRAPPGAPALGGYLTLISHSDQPLAIVKIFSVNFSSIEAHETIEKDGLMTMRPLTELILPPKGQLDFVPGGKHLMLIGLQRPRAAAESYPITLTDSSGCTTTVNFPQRSAPDGH
jgi:copper(I)-binding protein